VEDNPDGRESLSVHLELLGHTVVVAADGAEGLRKGLASPPEVRLVGIGLPVLDGYQVAERLRAAFGREVVLAACTANGESEDYRRAYRAGFDAHLTRPVDPEELVAWLNSQDSRHCRETNGGKSGDEQA
jgi:CheY-like chemotaxis protein